MSHLKEINNKILCLEKLKSRLESWKANGEKVIFTNGCFDILHKGHVEVLAKTADLGNRLIIGLNSDISIKRGEIDQLLRRIQELFYLLHSALLMLLFFFLRKHLMI